MIKYLLISIVTGAFILASCGDGDGVFGWEYCCDAQPGEICQADECSGGEGGGGGGCNGDGGGSWFYVWTNEDCGEHLHQFCASDLDDAKAQADAAYGTAHGEVAADPDSTRPDYKQVCGYGDTCILGADGMYSTGFSVFNDEQLAACEQAYDPGCTSWLPVDDQGNCP
jgi:hypothetical protein